MDLEKKVTKPGFFRGISRKIAPYALAAGVLLFPAACKELIHYSPVVEVPQEIVVKEGETARFSAEISDADGDALTKILSDNPLGVTFDSETDEFVVTAPQVDFNTHYDGMTLTVSDGINDVISSAVRVTFEDKDIPEAITKAADRLVETQNNDGGWEWTDPNTNKSEPSPYNTLGVTAQGVLDAYKLTGTQDYLDTAIISYNGIVARSESLSPATHRIRGPDISFLVDLSRETSNSEYADFAKTRWASAKAEFGGGTATGFAQYIRDGRVGQSLPSLVSWDVDLYLQGLSALNGHFPGQGFDTEAQNMAEVIHDFMYVDEPGFNLSDTGQNLYWLSHPGAIRAFVTTGLHSVEKNTLEDNLIANQQSDGHFGGVDDGLQTSAYSVISLLTDDLREPAINALGYLTGSQATNGGFYYPEDAENTEVSSEVMQALFEVTQW